MSKDKISRIDRKLDKLMDDIRKERFKKGKDKDMISKRRMSEAMANLINKDRNSLGKSQWKKVKDIFLNADISDKNKRGLMK